MGRFEILRALYIYLIIYEEAQDLSWSGRPMSPTRESFVAATLVYVPLIMQVMKAF